MRGSTMQSINRTITRKSFVKSAGLVGVATIAATTGIASVARADSASSDEAQAATDEQQQSYTPGSYTAASYGMAGYVRVKVTFDETSITDIQIVDENQTVGICEEVYETIPQAIIDSQSLGVDMVAGATITSAAVIDAVGQCVAQAGGDRDALAKVEVPVDATDEEFDYDVVVVGAGLAGYSTAIKAAQDGAKVALVEKQGVMGTAVFSSGIMYIAPTEDDVQGMYDKWIENAVTTSEYPTTDRVQDLCDVSPEVYEFLDGIGFEYTMGLNGNLMPVSSTRMLRNNVPIKLGTMQPIAKGGEAMIRKFDEACETNGVDVYRNTPVTQFITADDGSIAGVICETAHGTKTFNARAVVLTSGDYSRNNELVQKYCPESANDITSSAAGNTGACMELAVEAGAAVYESQEAMSGSLAFDPTDMPVCGQPFDEFPFTCMLVDYNGERKVREDAPNNHVQHQYFKDPERPCAGWAIMDREQARKVWIMDDLLAYTEAGTHMVKAYKADTIEELAELIEVDPATLSAQLEAYNAACEAGEDAEFSKDPQYLIALTEAPFYAVLSYSIIRAIAGGVITDSDFAVVREDGSEIPGLYATGIASSREYWGDYYPGAMAVTLCTHGGYLAGRNAAAYALGK